jgi:hypothetical protein
MLRGACGVSLAASRFAGSLLGRRAETDGSGQPAGIVHTPRPVLAKRATPARWLEISNVDD